MRLIDVLFPLGMAALVGGVLLFVGFSGRLKPGVRRVIERLFILIFYPSGVAFFGWKAFEAGRRGDIWTAVEYVFGTAVLIGTAARLLTARPRPMGEGPPQ